MKRVLTLLLLVPIGIVVIALAVTNRQDIVLSVPPQVGDAPLYAFTVPLYAVLFATLFIGMMIGSCATWIKQGKHRKQAREQKVEATKMAFEADKLKENAETNDNAASNENKALQALGLPAPSKAA